MQNVKNTNAAAPFSPTANDGNGKAARNSIGMQINGVFVRCGTIRMKGKAVEVAYRGVGGEYTAYIGAKDIPGLVGPSRMPCDVHEVHEDPGTDTTMITVVGRAWRSRSGRALMIKTVHTAGADMMVTWRKFLDVLEGRTDRATVSKFADRIDTTTPAPIAQPRANNEPVKSPVSKGLEGAF
ncbi:MAG: hypothetical protein QMC82_03430 [Methanolinea sp.]|jgi:hypothetical protein|nr:hypothetical protein [Methanolinea sp.]